MLHSGGFPSHHSFPSSLPPPFPSSQSNGLGFLSHTQDPLQKRQFPSTPVLPSFQERKYIGRRSVCVIANAVRPSEGGSSATAGPDKRHGRASAAMAKGKASQRSAGSGSRRSLSKKGFDVLEELMPMMTPTVTDPAKLKGDPSPKHTVGDSVSVVDASKGSFEGRDGRSSLRTRKKENGYRRTAYTQDDLKSARPKGSSENEVAFSSRLTQKGENVVSTSRVAPVEELLPSLTNEDNGAMNQSSNIVSSENQDAAKPSLSGQQVMWALRQAAIEKATRKQKQGKRSGGSKRIDDEQQTKKTVASTEVDNWEDARPIVIKPEWALQIEDLERRISVLKNSIYPS